VSGHGRTVLFVSHNMPAVESLCTRGVLLEHGSIRAIGSTHDVLTEYARDAAERRTISVADRIDREGDGRMRITGIKSDLRTGSACEIRLSYVGEPGLQSVDIGIGLFSKREEGVVSFSTRLVGATFETLPDSGTIICHIPKTAVIPGTYSVNIRCTVSGNLADWVRDVATIQVSSGDFYGTGRTQSIENGFVMVDHSWRAESSRSPSDT